MSHTKGPQIAGRATLLLGLAALAGVPAPGNGNAAAAAAVAIRSSAQNQVPACVTPERLMAFVASRNARLDAGYNDIAQLYRKHGESWRVRWDYAFFQMVVETNALMFRRGNGTPGDVKPRQNNFAGVGTTGGGVPGDSYPDISTGVLAQIQHLVVYSGERIDRPVAPRTQLVQDAILSESAPVARRRPVTFQDLAGRWAADRAYGRSIETIAEHFRAAFCTRAEPMPVAQAPGQASALIVPKPQPAARPAVAAAAPGPVPPARLKVASTTPVKVRAGAAQPHRADAMAEPKSEPAAVVVFAAPNVVAADGDASSTACRVQTASFGGRKSLLIRAVVGGQQQLTALQVLEGFEGSMSESFMRAHAPGGERVGEFATHEAAVAEAQRMCSAHASRSGYGD